MKLLIITAIIQELKPIIDATNAKHFKKIDKFLDIYLKDNIIFATVGVGEYLCKKNIDILINKYFKDINIVLLFGFAGAINSNKLDEIYFCNKLYELKFIDGKFKDIVDKEFNKLNYKLNKKYFKIELSKKLFKENRFIIEKKKELCLKDDVSDFIKKLNIKFASSLTSEIPILDSFIKNKIIEKGNITLVEMENYFLYEYLSKKEIEFFPFRIISDFADNNLKRDFENSCKMKLSSHIEIIKSLIEFFDSKLTKKI